MSYNVFTTSNPTKSCKPMRVPCARQNRKAKPTSTFGWDSFLSARQNLTEVGNLIPHKHWHSRLKQWSMTPQSHRPPFRKRLAINSSKIILHNDDASLVQSCHKQLFRNILAQWQNGYCANRKHATRRVRNREQQRNFAIAPKITPQKLVHAINWDNFAQSLGKQFLQKVSCTQCFLNGGLKIVREDAHCQTYNNQTGIIIQWRHLALLFCCWHKGKSCGSLLCSCIWIVWAAISLVSQTSNAK